MNSTLDLPLHEFVRYAREIQSARCPLCKENPAGVDGGACPRCLAPTPKRLALTVRDAFVRWITAPESW